VRLTPGTRVGPYEVVALLGAGGMAEVYRAKDTRLGREVAIKVVSEALGGDGGSLERFEREAKVAGSLNHPNIVALHDVGLHDGKSYFVTELLQGETLRQRLAKGPVPMATALDWAAQMAKGLAAAHERGIVHRDLKPENVFITRDGHVKLLDFGIAKLVEAAQGAEPHGLMDETVSPSGGRTGTRMVLGTPGYMSPEQVRGDPVDARTDLFGLGAVLYEMLSGRRAFPGGTVVESGYAILHNEPEPLPPTVPPLVTQVVHRSLQKDPAQRFQSARDLAFNLELLQTPTGSTATASLGAEAPIRRWRRWRWPLAGVVVALSSLGVGVFVVRSMRLPTPSVERMTFLRGTVSAGRFTPDGRVVYSASWGAQPEEIFTHAPGSPDTQSLGVPRARLLGVSTQGELVVSLRSGEHRQQMGAAWQGIEGAGGTLALVPGVGGAPREVTENVVFADWSRAGELAVVRYVDGKRQLEYPLGTPLFETAGWIAFPRVSPGGDSVAFYTEPSDAAPGELLVTDRKGTLRRLVTDFVDTGLTGLAWAPSGEEVWFTEGTTIWASSLSGGRRLIYRGVSHMELEDISRDGKVLVNLEDERREIAFVPPGQQRARELPWLPSTFLIALSDDGRQVLFNSYPNGEVFTYVRQTDGSPPLKLGAGQAVTFSPDEKGVLTLRGEDFGVLWLLPVGVGVPKKLPVEGLTVGSVRWLRDGKRLAVTGWRKGDKQWRLFVVPVQGGTPTSLSDAPITPTYLDASRDDRFAAVMGLDSTLIVYPLDGSPPIPLPELGKFSVPVGWTSDGQLWVSDNLKAFRDNPIHLLRYDISSRRVVEERSLASPDLTGLAAISTILITPDSQAIALEYVRRLGCLYLLDGLAPPRH